MHQPILWTEECEDHIARHGVTPREVEDVLYSRPRWEHPGRGDTIEVFGATAAGRPLVVIVVAARDVEDHLYVVTARPMTAQESRTYRRKGH